MASNSPTGAAKRRTATDSNPVNPMSPPTELAPSTPSTSKKHKKKHAAQWALPPNRGLLRWVTEPASSIKLLAIPVILHLNWLLLAPFVAPNTPSPFGPCLFISHVIPGSPADAPLYAKGYLDLVFIAYHIVLFCFIRQFTMRDICTPLGRYLGIRSEAKLERFGEQGYALAFFSIMSVWGVLVMRQLPTWWYKTEYMWIDYPHWQMKPIMKHYYLVGFSYWWQQLLVLLLGLEKPRKDYWEIVAHHVVTLWMVSFGYFMNTTHIGNAVFLSMDASEVFFSFSKLLNYLNWNRAKIVSFVVFTAVWVYFRHYINIKILYSVWFEWDLIPEYARVWNPTEGLWTTWWMKHQIFGALFLLQVLNLFWFFLILRILVRAIMTAEATDSRSDDEDEGEEESDKVE